MQIGDFKLVCFSQGIDPRLIDACVPFLEKHKKMFDTTHKIYGQRNVNSDLGQVQGQGYSQGQGQGQGQGYM